MATFLGILFLIVCVLLILVVLLQKGKGGGLGAAFGGGGGANSAFGTRTGDALTWVTIILTGLFLLLAIGAALEFRPDLGKVASPYATPNYWMADPAAAEMSVVLKSETKGARIHYTLDGSVPTSDSETYSEVPIMVQLGQTLQAMATRPGFDPSSVYTVTYLLPASAAPTLTPKTWPAGDERATLEVTIASDVEGGTIRYTLDGSDPTLESAEYTAPISVTKGQTVSARVFLDLHEAGEIARATYGIAPVAVPEEAPVTGTLDVLPADLPVVPE